MQNDSAESFVDTPTLTTGLCSVNVIPISGVGTYQHVYMLADDAHSLRVWPHVGPLIGLQQLLHVNRMRSSLICIHLHCAQYHHDYQIHHSMRC